MLKAEIDTRAASGKTIATLSPTNLSTNPQPDIANRGNPVTFKTQIIKAIQKLNNKTSSGSDGIWNIFIKNIFPTYIEFLAVILFNYIIILFNNIINNDNYYPKSWKIAKIIPLSYKGKEPTDINSYRLISLLSNLSKLFETVINTVLLA